MPASEFTPHPPKLELTDRIEALRADIEKLIEARALELQQTECPNLPIASIKLMLTRGYNCTCDTAMRILKGAAKRE